MNERLPPPADAVVETTRMTFGEHLEELRTRMIRSVVATVLALVVTMSFGEELLRLVTAPYREVMVGLHLDPSLKAAGPTQGVVTLFKVSLMAAVALAAPVWIYQLWAFIAAGLYEREKRPVRKYFPLSLALFLGGVLFGYFLLLPTGLRYLVTFISPDLVQNWTGISEYLSLFFTLTILLGVTFELPVVMLGLAKAGLVGSEAFRAKRRIVIVVIFIVAGILTPPDPVTQPLVAVPLCFLYELGILAAAAAEGRKREKIDWKKVWGKAKWVVAAALIAFVFRERLAKTWRGADADARAELDPAQPGVPWRPVARARLGVEADGGFRIRESPAETLVAAVGGGRVVVLRFRPSRELAIAVPVDSRGFEVLAMQAGATLWHADVVDDLPTADVVTPVAEALETGSEKTAEVARKMLEAAAGATFDADPAKAAEQARAWGAARGAAPFPVAR